MRKLLTDRGLAALKAAKKGQRYEVRDSVAPGLAVRVSDTGRKNFVLVARYPGSTNPTRRLIGEYGKFSLEQARDTARDWHAMIRKGVDPAEEEERKRKAALREQASTFSVASEEFLSRHVAGQRRAGDVKRIITNVLKPKWGKRPVASITRSDVLDLISGIAKRAPYQAHAVFGVVRTFFTWAIEAGDFGLEASPCDRVKPRWVIGERKPRQRALDDAELVAFWRATERMGYPHGSLLRLLLLTGSRRGEGAGARWREINESNALWTVPPERFKSDARHLVPLSKSAVALLEGLPRFTAGDFLFSSTMGERPVRKHAEAKARLDRLMKEELGRDLEPFVVHDLRRTVRTGLASLRVPEEIAERCLGHGPRGLKRVYDQHPYIEEMREAMELWAAKLRDATEPAPENVVKLRRK